MPDCALLQLNFGIKRLLVAAALIALTVPSSPGQAGTATTPTSTLPANAPYVPTMTFDVASVRESNPGPAMHRVGGSFAAHSSNLKLENVTLTWLLEISYGADSHKMMGQPDWAGQISFNVQAKSDEATDLKLASLSKEDERLEQQHMMQALLAERFKLKAHWATQEGNIYNLVLAKGGSKLQPAGSMPPTPEELKWLGDSKTLPPLHQQGDGRLGFEFYGHDCPIESLAKLIGGMMQRDVVNDTGLSGNFDFRIRYHGNTPPENPDQDPTVWPPLTDALEDQVGLKLVGGRGPVKELVIDHVEKPSDN